MKYKHLVSFSNIFVNSNLTVMKKNFDFFITELQQIFHKTYKVSFIY